MLGAIAGDIAGSIYEARPWLGPGKDFPVFTSQSRFTDDTVMSVAVAEALVRGYGNPDLTREEIVRCMHDYGHKYPHAGYGGRFACWIGLKNPKPYNSFGNGSAMRVSPVAWAYDTIEDVEKYAQISAEVTHNHPEGIKGACAVAGAVFLGRMNHGKREIRDYVTGKYGYDLDRPLADIRETYHFDVTCQGSVPEAIIAFLESVDFEDAVRNAIWLGGDADTQAAMAGSIAEAFYGGVSEDMAQQALSRLDGNLYYKFRSWQDWLANEKGK